MTDLQNEEEDNNKIRYEGDNSYMPNKIDFSLPKLNVYNGPIDPKDAPYYEDYHSKVIDETNANNV